MDQLTPQELIAKIRNENCSKCPFGIICDCLQAVVIPEKPRRAPKIKPIVSDAWATVIPRKYCSQVKGGVIKWSY
jgi:hypothetical protein